MTKYHANKTYKVSEIIRALEYQYPLSESTFAICMKCKSHGGRGGLTCSKCLEDELAEVIGKSLAWEVHQALADYTRLKHWAMYGEDSESQNKKATS